ncbi:MAG TPA: right-handed parallel beta-helix repeat-containing protein [Gaiellaceae bacterium]|nr:right-handed parallel beta-helix repeat-containing protein [Gaiellaceae bacterium]
MRRLVLGIVLAVGLGATVAGPANANPRVVTCGDTITQPGTWNVRGNCSGAGITIAASDVVLKLNGHRLDGGGNGDGIALDSVSDIRIEGPGRISNYQYGINFAYVDDAHVEHVTVVGSTAQGVALYDSGSNVFKYDAVRGSQYHGFTLNGSNGNLLAEDASTGNGSNGIFLASSSGDRVAYDSLNGNGGDGVDVGTVGNGPANNNTIKHVTANHNGGFGVALESTSSGNAVSYSRAHGNHFEDAVDQTCGANSWSDNSFGSFANGCS